MKKVKYSVLELALIPAGKTAGEVFAHVSELAVKAESLGYERFWLAEHHNSLAIASSATPVLIGQVAGVTRKMRVGSGGIMLPNHSPLIVAEQFATLANLYPGRIDLGLGRAPGTDQLTANAIRPGRMASVLQFPEEVKEIQQYFSIDNSGAKVRVPFAEGVEVPLYILGSSTDSAHVAAKLGLPYAFASHFATGQLEEAISIYKKQFRPSAQLASPYVMAAVNIVLADSFDAAERELTTLIQMFYHVLTGKQSYLPAPVKMTPMLRDIWRHPQVRQMLKYTFWGDGTAIKGDLLAFLEMAGADEIIAVSNLFDFKARERSFEIFAAVMEELKAIPEEQ